MTPETPRSRRAFLHGGLWTMGLRGATIVGTLTGARFLVWGSTLVPRCRLRKAAVCLTCMSIRMQF